MSQSVSQMTPRGGSSNTSDLFVGLPDFSSTCSQDLQRLSHVRPDFNQFRNPQFSFPMETNAKSLSKVAHFLPSILRLGHP